MFNKAVDVAVVYISEPLPVFFCTEFVNSKSLGISQEIVSEITSNVFPLELHLTTSELWFGQEQEGILPQLLSRSGIV